MRVPVSWLREYAPIPEPYDALEVGRRLTQAGLEVETVEQAGHDVHGVITAQVIAIEELTEFKKPIRYCRVAVSDAELTADPETLTGVICGAVNFREGDRVAFATVGAVLPGGFEITAAKKYGRTSHGMICAVDELGIGEDHTGILVLPPDTPLGVDFAEYAGLRDDVLEITVTPDRGYAVSIRGVARELASAYQVPFTDPAQTFVPGEDASGMDAASTTQGNDGPWPAEIGDPTACDRFVLREVRGFNPHASTPLWMAVRLARCGMRSVSLAVDVTNYLMIELGQPLHAFDRAKLHGTIVVRRGRPGETLTTLDHVTRALHEDDILITDDSGPISMAGTMGGLETEIDDDSTDIVIEGAHFSDTGTAKMSRRHRLHSEASYRFERGTDRELPPRATARAAALLASLGGATIVPGVTRAEVPVTPVTISMAADYPDRVAGVVYGMDTVVARLQEVGCEVRSTPAAQAPTIAPWRVGAPEPPADHDYAQDHGGRHDRQLMVLLVTPPSWRPDHTAPADLAEEVIRLEGYGNVPVRHPRATAGAGLARAAAGAAGDRPHTWRQPASLRCTATRSPRRTRPTTSCSSLRTRAAPRSRSPTRSVRTSRSCAPPCFLACSAPWCGTSAGVSRTPPCSRPARCSCRAPVRPASRRSSRSTGAPPRRNSRPSPPRCPTSRSTWPASSRATASCPAGGDRDAPRPGPTRSRRHARSAR